MNDTNYYYTNDTNSSSAGADCGGGEEDGGEQHEHLSFWIEGIAEIAVCLTGLVGNTIALPILCSAKLASSFNRLLVFLTIFDNLFILCCILEATRKFFLATDLQLLLFVYFLYQLQNVALTCSAYATVILGVERYLAVSRPVQYHIMVSGGNTWQRVCAYMCPTVAFCVLFNLPKWFELRASADWDEAANATRIVLKPTELRLNDDYVFYYLHLARFFVTGIFPFLSLVFLNSGIHRAMQLRRATSAVLTGSANRRHKNGHNGHNAGNAAAGAHQQQEAEENRQAVVLLAIVLLFLVCNVPRIVLNAYEVFNVAVFRDNVDNECYRLPAWVDLTTSLSLLLMTINSSVNFFVYCFANPTFQREFLAKTGRLRNWLAELLPSCGRSNAGGEGADTGLNEFASQQGRPRRRPTQDSVRTEAVC